MFGATSAVVDVPGKSEEEIRADAREIIDTFGPYFNLMVTTFLLMQNAFKITRFLVMKCENTAQLFLIESFLKSFYKGFIKKFCYLSEKDRWHNAKEFFKNQFVEDIRLYEQKKKIVQQT